MNVITYVDLVTDQKTIVEYSEKNAEDTLRKILPKGLDVSLINGPRVEYTEDLIPELLTEFRVPCDYLFFYDRYGSPKIELNIVEVSKTVEDED